MQCTREQTHLLPLVFAKPPFWPAFSFSAFSAAASSFFFLQYNALQRVGGAVLGTCLAAELQRGRTLIQTSLTQSVRVILLKGKVFVVQFLRARLGLFQGFCLPCTQKEESCAQYSGPLSAATSK